MDLTFLPAWPPTLNQFLLFGVILLAGLVAGELSHRTGFLPRITGFIAIGLLLGPSALGWLTPEMLAQSKVFVDIALGLILFQLGMQLDFKTLGRDRSLLLSALAESALSFLLVYAVLVWFGIPPLHAAVAAAIGISSSPAVVLLVVRELNASGPLTSRTLSLVAINNVLSFFAFTALLPLLHYSHHSSITTMILQPLYRVVVSLLVAYLLGRAAIGVARLMGKNESSQFALLVGMVIAAIGLSKMLDCSSLLTLLALGVMTRNLDGRDELMKLDFGHGGQIFFVLLFVIAGANLHLAELVVWGWAALAFVAARIGGKMLGLLLLSRASGLSYTQSSLLAMTLVPMAGLAIGLIQTTAAMYPSFAATLSAIVLAGVAILETVGPVATEFALHRSGEVHARQKIGH